MCLNGNNFKCIKLITFLNCFFLFFDMVGDQTQSLHRLCNLTLIDN